MPAAKLDLPPTGSSTYWNSHLKGEATIDLSWRTRMARNTELVRQWEILRDIDSARTGIPMARRGAARGVPPRTIRRDLDALGRAGFPVFDEKVNGTSMWKLSARPFRGLEQMGLGTMELCAMYLARTVLSSAGAMPMADEMDRAFAKIESAVA